MKYLSKFLPVNIKRVNAAVYTQNNMYPADLLLKAKAALINRNSQQSDVVFDDTGVTFIDHPEIQWAVPDIYLACEAYQVAVDNNFSFYTVRNKEGIPQLFVSKYFKGCRLLINAYTFETILVKKPELVKRVSSMVDKQYEAGYCVYIYKVISDLENGSTNYLDAIITGRGTEDECMVVNPITTLFADDNVYYDKPIIDDYRTLLENQDAETETVIIDDDMFQRKNVTNFAPLPKSHVQNIVKMYDRLCAKKCNYINVIGDDWETYFYVSTNWRYFVNAKTFECIVIKNANIKRLLQMYVKNSTTPVEQLLLCWELAKTEPD